MLVLMLLSGYDYEFVKEVAEDSASSSCALTKSREKALAAREISAFPAFARDGRET